MPTSAEQGLQSDLIAFYSRYANDIGLIKKFWELELNQLALAYTYRNALPKEAVAVACRVKSIESVIQKLTKLGSPQFDFFTDVINDLVGARITCWFIDDCYGIYAAISASHKIGVIEGYTKDYNINPKPSGYRAIHCLVQKHQLVADTKREHTPLTDDMCKCEIQIRTKMQDSWAEITHNFHYKAILAGVENKTYESFMADIANRLDSEDVILVRLRKLYQYLARTKTQSDGNETYSDIPSELP